MSTLFEKLLHGELPCAKVYEDELVFAFMDGGQVNDGHVIVATKAPRETLLDCTDDEAAALMRAARRIAIAVQAAFQPEGITVLQANRPAGWQTVPHLHLHVLPRRAGDGVELTWPRKTLDHVLVRAAQRAGAWLLAPLRFEAPLLDGERVVGARLRNDGGRFDIAARWVVLATGAAAQPLMAAGLCERRTPSGVALRGYVRHPAMAGRINQLQIVWHPRLRGGYGWVFPAPGGLFNVGTGLVGSHAVQGNGKGRMQDVNLRRMLDDFCSVYAPARELMAGGELQGEIKGAPLRCTLRGARWSRPGMLATGEAAGSTYSFSGEGIGKAMETGLLAAEALLAQAGNPQGCRDDSVRERYEASLRALQPRFDLYETASGVNRHPWLADLVVWRARRSPRILKRLSGVLEETQSPGRLFSWSGITKLMFE